MSVGTMGEDQTMSEYGKNGKRAREAAERGWAAWRESGRWYMPDCENGEHVWADGGGVYSIVTGENGPVTSCTDGEVYGWEAHPVTLPADVLAMITEGYSMCEHVAGIPAADVLPDAGDSYVWVVDGVAYLADEI